MEVINITYIPTQHRAQAMLSFEYKGKTEHTVIFIDFEKTGVTTEFTKIATDKNFLSLCQEAIILKIKQIDNPIL